jgi:hypothetical protein
MDDGKERRLTLSSGDLVTQGLLDDLSHSGSDMFDATSLYESVTPIGPEGLVPPYSKCQHFLERRTRRSLTSPWEEIAPREFRSQNHRAESTSSPDNSLFFKHSIIESNTFEDSKRKDTRTIGSYVIVGTLGEGTYGKVVLAYLNDSQDKEHYALKILKKTQGQSVRSELACLLLIARQNSESVKNGSNFLQRILESFEDLDRIYLVLVCRFTGSL